MVKARLFYLLDYTRQSEKLGFQKGDKEKKRILPDTVQKTLDFGDLKSPKDH